MPIKIQLPGDPVLRDIGGVFVQSGGMGSSGIPAYDSLEEITSPTEGMVIKINGTPDKYYIYKDSAWVELVDVSGTTAEEADVKDGEIFYKADGTQAEGTLVPLDISDADAAVGDVVASKTFYATSGGKKTGTMTDRGTVNTDITTKSQEVTIASGKHSGSGKVKISATEQAKIIAGNIKKNVSILGITGTLEESSGGYNYCDVQLDIEVYDQPCIEITIKAAFVELRPANMIYEYLSFEALNSRIVTSKIAEFTPPFGREVQTLRFELPNSAYPWKFVAILSVARTTAYTSVDNLICGSLPLYASYSTSNPITNTVGSYYYALSPYNDGIYTTMTINGITSSMSEFFLRGPQFGGSVNAYFKTDVTPTIPIITVMGDD